MGIISQIKGELLGGTSLESGESEPGLVVKFLLAIRRSLTMFTIAMGAAMIVTGVVIELTFVNQGVLAAMFVIWGVSFLFIGLVGYGFVMWLRSR